jgi:hypothetical protein
MKSSTINEKRYFLEISLSKKDGLIRELQIKSGNEERRKNDSTSDSKHLLHFPHFPHSTHCTVILCRYALGAQQEHSAVGLPA